ncbi:hypothetical protein E4U32_007149 [Claviceps aff. humidiphila group G2b]|nr:hypothetical protein E4U32_007149 [Claviceps aff. humidiphila group G2b]
MEDTMTDGRDRVFVEVGSDASKSLRDGSASSFPEDADVKNLDGTEPVPNPDPTFSATGHLWGPTTFFVIPSFCRIFSYSCCSSSSASLSPFRSILYVRKIIVWQARKRLVPFQKSLDLLGWASSELGFWKAEAAPVNRELCSL